MLAGKEITEKGNEVCAMLLCPFLGPYGTPQEHITCGTTCDNTSFSHSAMASLGCDGPSLIPGPEFLVCGVLVMSRKGCSC